MTAWPSGPIPALPVALHPLAIDATWIIEEGESYEFEGSLGPDFTLRAAQTVDLSTDMAVFNFYAASGTPRYAPQLPPQAPTRTITDVGAAREDLQRAFAATMHIASGLLGRDVVEPWRTRGFDVVNASEASAQLQDTLWEGLAAYRPRISFTFEDRLAQEVQRFGPQPPPDYERLPLATLFEAMCRDAFNLFVEGRPIHECPTCGLLFVRQVGEAKHGQHRSRGVKYCSPRCGNLDRQRRHRARQRGQGDST